MKFCSECNHSPLPYLMVALIATIVGFVTWLTLGLSTYEPLIRLAVGIAVFLAVGGTLLHYVSSCIQRHCQHQQRYARAPSTPRA